MDENISSLNAFPNPTPGKLTISFVSNSNTKYRMKVVNVIGSIIIDESISAIEGINTHDVNLENVAKGLYFLSLQADGAEAKTLRIEIDK